MLRLFVCLAAEGSWRRGPPENKEDGVRDMEQGRDYDRRQPDEKESWKKDSNRAGEDRRDDEKRFRVRESKDDDEKDNDKYTKSSGNRRFEKRGFESREEKDFVRASVFSFFNFIRSNRFLQCQ